MANPLQNFPWLAAAWQRLTAELDKLHHGLLLTGVDGVAKREFAVALSQRLLCQSAASAEPCGACRQCKLFNAHTHPDFHVLTTEQEWRQGRLPAIAAYCDRYHDAAAREKRANPSRVIAVEQIRILGERFTTHAHLAPHKVALIVPAERMNTNAANALLKLLEEPPPHTTLILVTALPGFLPPTIRSRCVQIAIPTPDPQTAGDWLSARISQTDAPPLSPTQIHHALQQASGAPLGAWDLHRSGQLQLRQELHRDLKALTRNSQTALDLAARLAKQDLPTVLGVLQHLSCDLIRAYCGVNDSPDAPNLGHASAQKIFALYDKLGEYRRIAQEQINPQLALEEIVLAWQQAVRNP